MISKLKSQFHAKFKMRDPGATKHIPRMKIGRDGVRKNLWLGVIGM